MVRPVALLLALRHAGCFLPGARRRVLQPIGRSLEPALLTLEAFDLGFERPNRIFDGVPYDAGELTRGETGA